MLIDVPDANEVQWEEPASNWEPCQGPTAFSLLTEAQLTVAPTFGGAALGEGVEFRVPPDWGINGLAAVTVLS